MGTNDDKVKRSGVRMQHDDAGRISVLYAHPETDALRFGSVSERRDVCHPRAATQTEWLGHGNGLDDREFCVVLSTESQCARERRPGRSGEINRTKNARKLNHD